MQFKVERNEIGPVVVCPLMSYVLLFLQGTDIVLNFLVLLICRRIKFGKNVLFTEKLVFYIVFQRDLGASVFGQKDSVSWLNCRWNMISILVTTSWSNSNNLEKLLLWFVWKNVQFLFSLTMACKTLACAFSGMTIPPLVLVTASNLCTNTRSKSGISRFTALAYKNMRAKVIQTSRQFGQKLCNWERFRQEVSILCISLVHTLFFSNCYNHQLDFEW